MEFAEVLYACLERFDKGGDAEIEAACVHHPEHAERLRREVSRLLRLGLVGTRIETQQARPERLGGFRLIELLGEGGMGLVYAAEEEALGRRVALKMVRPEQLYFPGARERFRREVETIARLQHPGIVPVYTVGEDGGVPFFTMEPIDGCMLDDVIGVLRGSDPAKLGGRSLARAIESHARAAAAAPPARGALFELSWVDACVRIALEIAEALEYAHGRGLVHRDVKPSNIAITRSGRAMLLDFGLTHSTTAERITRTGSQPGSLPYMSAEQIAGEQDLDGRTDVYSLGVTLYELLTLARAFPDGSSVDVVRRIQHGDFERPRERNRAIPRDVEVVCLKAMSLERDARYETAGDFARDLGHVLARRPIEARPASTLLKVRRWAQRHPAWAVGGTLGLLLLVGTPSSLFVQQMRANDEIHAKNTELNAALVRARDESRRAEDNLQSAFDAVDRMLTRVGDKRLENVPGMDVVRQEVLQEAFGFYTRLDRQHAANPVNTGDAIRTRLSLASVLEILGLPDQADALERDQVHDSRLAYLAAPESETPTRMLARALRTQASRMVRDGRERHAPALLVEAAVLLQQAACSTGQDPLLDIDVWNLRLTHAELCFTSGDVTTARAMYDELDEHGTLYYASGALPRNLWMCLVAALVNKGFLLNQLNEPKLALDAAQRALAICARDSDGGWDRTREYQRVIGSIQVALAHDLLGEPDEDIAWQRRAVEAARALIAHHPDASEYRELLQTVKSNLAFRLARTDREDEAFPLWESAVSELEVIVAAQPNVPRIRYALSKTLRSLAIYYWRRREIDTGLTYARRALDEGMRGWEASPRNPEWADNVGGCSELLANFLCQTQDHRRVVEVLRDEPERMVELGVAYAPGRYRQMAGYLARCARLAAADATLSDDERTERADDCDARALRCLECAVERGYKDRNDLSTAKELASVRDLSGFAALMERLAPSNGDR